MLKRRVSETKLDTYAPRMRPADLLASLAESLASTVPTPSETSEQPRLPLALNR